MGSQLAPPLMVNPSVTSLLNSCESTGEHSIGEATFSSGGVLYSVNDAPPDYDSCLLSTLSRVDGPPPLHANNDPLFCAQATDFYSRQGSSVHGATPHKCAGYQFEFKSSGRLSRFIGVFSEAHSKYEAEIKCSAYPLLRSSPGDKPKEIFLKMTIENKTEHVPVKVEWVQVGCSPHDKQCQVSLVKPKSKWSLRGDVERGFIKQLDEEMRHFGYGMVPVLMNCYHRVYFHESGTYQLSPFSFQEGVAEDIAVLTKILEPMGWYKVARAIGLSLSEIQKIDRSGSNELKMLKTFRQLSKTEQRLPWQQLFNLLSDIPGLEHDAEFHRAAKLFNVRLPSHWTLLPEIPKYHRHIHTNLLCSYKVPAPTLEEPEKIHLSFSHKYFITEICLLLGISRDEFKAKADEISNNLRLKGKVETINEELYVHLIQQHLDSSPMTWEQLFQVLEDIPALDNEKGLARMKTEMGFPQTEVDKESELEKLELYAYELIDYSTLYRQPWRRVFIGLVEALTPYSERLAEALDIPISTLSTDVFSQQPKQLVFNLIERKSEQSKFTLRQLAEVVSSLEDMQYSAVLQDFCRSLKVDIVAQ
ncbi:hypothetical protein D5018_16735 [Parashewanella curva]|uniref:Uncharacterized protein n=1 Tax=Parashewanella curva TaxID=2338552 RepID=A0A3L8PSZ2_9GAMM|nr:hypothetical protein [Parashewanella curva]RLV58540.1 hypothetical protein D5018_16735 [Parashewanella curva]